MRLSVVCGVALLAVAVGSAVASGGVPASHETLVKDMLETLDKITKELAKITDAKSASDAKPQLKLAATHLLGLHKKADQIKQPNKAEKDRLTKEYKERFDDALKKLSAESARVKTIPGGDEALKEIDVLKKKKPKK